MRRLTFENETHWRTTDIQRIVRLAMTEAGVEVSEPRVVRVLYPKKPRKTKKKPTTPTKPVRRRNPVVVSNPSVCNLLVRSNVLTQETVRVRGGERKGEEVTTEITIFLPRRGSKDPHPVAMVALAASRAVAGVVDEDTTLLPFSDVFFLVNNLSYFLAKETAALYDDPDGKLDENRKRLFEDRGEVTPPSWADPSKLYIAKLKDKFKDATFLAFVKKRETYIKRCKSDIKREEKIIADATRRMKKAQQGKKTAELAIRNATERRKVSS